MFARQQATNDQRSATPISSSEPRTIFLSLSQTLEYLHRRMIQAACRKEQPLGDEFAGLRSGLFCFRQPASMGLSYEFCRSQCRYSPWRDETISVFRTMLTEAMRDGRVAFGSDDLQDPNYCRLTTAQVNGLLRQNGYPVLKWSDETVIDPRQGLGGLAYSFGTRSIHLRIFPEPS